MNRFSVLICTIAVAALASGCANVEPWQKETLAKPAMSLSSDAITNGLDDHTYFSRESSSGGRGFGGGGCGCN